MQGGDLSRGGKDLSETAARPCTHHRYLAHWEGGGAGCILRLNFLSDPLLMDAGVMADSLKGDCFFYNASKDTFMKTMECELQK